MAELKNTIVNGVLNVNGDAIASKIIKRGGADTHVLLAGGGTKAISDFSTSDTKVTQSNTTTPNWRKVVLSYQDSSTAGTATTSNTNQVYVTPNIEVQPSTGNVRIAGSIYEGGTALSSKYAAKDHNHDGTYLGKTTYEWNKEYAASANGAVSLGRYNLYDTQLTFDITSTTSEAISGKLVIASQNGSIKQARVFGNATGSLVSKLVIYQTAITGNRSWIEVFCNFAGYSKNKVHIYAVGLDSGTVENQMQSVTFTNGVPSPIASGYTKWTGTIVNDIDARGFVAGPSESTDNAVVRFDGATGKVIQNSGVIIDDNNKLKINATDTGGQSNVFQALSTSASEDGPAWIGRSLMGSKTLTFLMGTYNNMAAIGAHSWKDANTADTAAWAPMYFQPDGGATAAIYMGQNGTGWKANTGTLIVKGSSTANAGTVDVNGTFTATTIKKTNGADTHVLLAGGGTKAIDDIVGTTYGADRGISLVNGKFGHSNTAITAQTTKGLYKISYDAYGHITGTESFTLPNPASYYWANVKVSASSSTATTPSVQKLGITGSTTTTASAAVTMEYDSSYKALKFVFA